MYSFYGLCLSFMYITLMYLTHYTHDQFLLLNMEIHTVRAQWGLATPLGAGSQGDPGQSVPFPVEHNPTGAGDRIHQQLPSRQEMMRWIMSWVHPRGSVRSKRRRSQRQGWRWPTACAQGPSRQQDKEQIHLQHCSKHDNVPQSEHKQSIAWGRLQVQQVRVIKDYEYTQGPDTNYVQLVAKRLLKSYPQWKQRKTWAVGPKLQSWRLHTCLTKRLWKCLTTTSCRQYITAFWRATVQSRFPFAFYYFLFV